MHMRCGNRSAVSDRLWRVFVWHAGCVVGTIYGCHTGADAFSCYEVGFVEVVNEFGVGTSGTAPCHFDG